MKSSLNFEELLKALGEFWDLLFKCLNNQIWCPFIYTWNANSDTLTDKINVSRDLQFQFHFWEYVRFCADFASLLSAAERGGEAVKRSTAGFN